MLLKPPIARAGPPPWKTRFLHTGVWNLAALHRRTVGARARVVAITGSLGKSTATRALIAVLDCPSVKNPDFNAGRMLAMNVLGIRPGDRHRVVEIGIDSPGQMRPMARMLRPDVAVVTSIASEHLRSFGTLEGTRHEKAFLLRELSADGTAVLNGDDANVRWMATQTSARKVFFGFDAGNDVCAENVRRDEAGCLVFDLRTTGSRFTIHSRFVGRHQISALLAAVAVALNEGVAEAAIVQRLESLEPTPLRLSFTRLENGVTLLRDDYKSTWESMISALDTLAELPARRRIVVIGEISEPPGSQGPLYAELGRRIAGVADFGIHVGRMRRRYTSGWEKAGWSSERMLDASVSVRAATKMLRERLSPGDLVLVKGRDNQKLARIALALEGRTVMCNLSHCSIYKYGCANCPKLGAPTIASESEPTADEGEQS